MESALQNYRKIIQDVFNQKNRIKKWLENLINILEKSTSEYISKFENRVLLGTIAQNNYFNNMEYPDYINIKNLLEVSKKCSSFYFPKFEALNLNFLDDIFKKYIYILSLMKLITEKISFKDSSIIKKKKLKEC